MWETQEAEVHEADHRRTAPQHRDARADLAQERLDLVVQIAVLDERFGAGEVSDVDYRVQRTRAKQRLHQLTLAEGA